jgi:nucleoside-diphosphate-sugar epimerase
MTAPAALLTGGAGFLGKYLAAGLAATHRVTVLDRRPLEGYASLEADLTVPASINLAGQHLELVVHAAGLAHFVPRTEDDEQRFFDVNAGGTRNLLQALERLPEPPESFVLISTVAVYGRVEGELLDELTPLAATDPYGASKREAEELVTEWAARRGVRWTILRLPLVYAEDAPGNLKAMREGIRSGRYAGIGQGTARRSMVRAEDVGGIVDRAARVGGVFHLTDGLHPSFREIEEAMAQAVGRNKPRRLPYRMALGVAWFGDKIYTVTRRRFPLDTNRLEKMTRTLTFCDRRAREELGWAPRGVQ